ncbi:MAG: PorV/PorQ family protein [candidate division KSB1 bacterium]|nr:PorV/PorQ family protein [candidate division KSB1 bacterium]MDZ7301130.1 PorV/PorQ family protein [candidate division KSB1 bacterium]MDZ7311986.1 PorV/PorQ family protein [candidate division KSB1 bacterium]
MLILLGMDSRTYGQEVKKIGTSSAVFLQIPVGAKGIAMGSAFTAIADDGSAMFWNPGNIAKQSKRALFVHHSPWLPGLGYYYLAFSLPVENWGVFGINVASLKSDEMEITTPEAPMGTGETFTAASTAVGIAFARRLTDRFSLGANFKYINERIFHSSATGFAFDVGTMFLTPFRDLRFGVSVSNMGTDMRMDGEDLNTYVDVAPAQEGNNDNIVAKLKTDRFDLPIIMRIGISWDLRLPEGARLTLACDGVNPNDNAQSLNVGFEFAAFRESLVLRGGFNELFLEDRENGLTLGAGLRISYANDLNLALSYAYQDFAYLGGVNHFSIEIIF